MSSRPPYSDDLESREDPYNVTQASRIYFLPNLMTAGNLFCGFVAVIHCIQARLAELVPAGEYLNKTSAGHYTQAVWFIFSPRASTCWMAASRAWAGASRFSARSSTRWRTWFRSASPRR